MAQNTHEPLASDQGRDMNGANGFGSCADELKRQSEKLQKLAEELKAREEADAEMRRNYPHYKKAVYALLREKFKIEIPPLTDKDIEDLAAEEGALPLEAFMHELAQ
jgi:hypothetical protein